MGTAACDCCLFNKIFIFPPCLSAVLKDKRNKFVALTDSEFSIRVTDITFKDGGIYKCLRYNNPVSTTRYKVIVIGEYKHFPISTVKFTNMAKMGCQSLQ